MRGVVVRDRPEMGRAAFSTWALSGRPFDRNPFCWFAGLMKTTLDLPPELVREMKLRALHQQRKLKEIAEEALRRGLGLSANLPEHSLKTKIKFPLFESAPQAPASAMTAEQLIALEQEILLEEDVNRARGPL